MSLAKLIFILGARLRNPLLWKHYNDLKNSEKWELNQLKELQQTRLLIFLEFAVSKSSHYKKIFESIGWKQGDKIDMELFEKIPTISKSQLISENEDIHSKAEFKKIFYCETSGTSGQVLNFRRDESWDSFNRASIMRGYSWYKVKPWDFNIYFWGYNFSSLKQIKLRMMDLLVNRYRMFDYSGKTMQQLVQKVGKAVFIEGYSSMIYELACAAENHKLDTSQLKMVKGTSEKIFPHYNEKTLKVFGKKIISEYGAAETGIIAFECPEGKMHINMEGVYVEVDDKNEIIVTNFHSHSFPVIRYKLGDSVKLSNETEKCKCGMAHPVIEEVTGRVGKVIEGATKRFPSLTFYYIFKNLYFDKGLHFNYQAHQHDKGKIEIWIKESFGPDEEALILAEADKYFYGDVKVVLKNGGDFRLQEGKLRDFVTTLN